MAAMPIAQKRSETTSRPPSWQRTSPFMATQDEVLKIVAAGPRGAVALAGLRCASLLALWLAFFLFVFLPRGAVG